MKYLIYLLIILFPFGQLLRVNLVGSEIVFHPNDFIVGILSVWFFLLNYKKICSDKLFKPIVLVTLTMAVSLLFNIYRLNNWQLLSASLYLVRFVAYAGLYFVAKDYPILKRGLVIGIIFVAAAGIAQYLLIPDVSFLKALDWDDHYYRLISTFLDPGFTGIILLIGLLISQDVVLRARRDDVLLGIVFFISMMLTYSRATYLAYLVSFAVMAFYQKSLKIFLIAALALIIAIPLLPKSTGEGTKLDRENSTWARINNWKESIGIWQKSPIFGVGFNTYRYSRPAASSESHSGAGADSSLFLILATTGIVGLLAYLYLVRGVIILGRHNVVFMAVAIGVFTHSWFNNTLFYPWVMELLWVLLGSREKT